ncbi:ATP12 family chaperone protein [Octadecabacter ascidiaceicola]|uniref:ATP12 chaperone protein n=1 Tax=Octadecabacter ascidiaceicola TaxID=1655543 RepID=A0A238K9T6_9RHOB|nr:ATP12 family protein [Octadecabacter ascidiaceicola]SMX39609.1 ATP12 chaperone protein [Octadecabacter ascidiaceicola]
MSEWVAKRFWTDVNVVEQDGGFAVQLDTRAVKTPAKAPLVVPSRDMGDAIAAEWRAVDEKIDPNVMPFTRSANAAIDKVSVQFEEVATMLAAYGGSDLLCYRADSPAELVERQIEMWDPLLDWAHEAFGARLISTKGVMPVTQDETALNAISSPLFAATSFELAALHDLVAMSGSLVLALTVTQRRLSASDAWELSRLDENWQAEQWGVDDDDAQVAEIKQNAFMHAARFHQMAS